MPRRIGHKKVRRRNFIKEWREFRGLTQAQLAERLECSEASISRVETGKQNLTGDLRDAIASALAVDAASLEMRNPAEQEIWSLWDTARPAQKRQIIEIAKTLLKTGTEGD
jgi:transcriptional regulator with XRE-family HTH domain